MHRRFPVWPFERLNMKTTNLFWAIIWGVVCALAIVGFFWNPAQIVVAVIAAIFCGLFIKDYHDTKNI